MLVTHGHWIINDHCIGRCVGRRRGHSGIGCYPGCTCPARWKRRGITLSKFSARRVTGSHADASSPDEPARLFAPKEASAASAATAAETKKRKQRTYRNGNAANLLF